MDYMCILHANSSKSLDWFHRLRDFGHRCYDEIWVVNIVAAIYSIHSSSPINFPLFSNK